MKLLVGLGNPGPKYAFTRHNAGFILLDLLLVEQGLSWQGSKFDGIFAKGSLLGHDVCFLKPQTFVNLSGRSVAQAMRFYKTTPAEVVIVHDELDLEFGKVKAKLNGGHGGHNGIRSIIQDCGSQDFRRLKVGIGRPQAEGSAISNWVLEAFSEQELKILKEDVLTAMKVRLEGLLN